MSIGAIFYAQYKSIKIVKINTLQFGTIWYFLSIGGYLYPKLCCDYTPFFHYRKDVLSSPSVRLQLKDFCSILAGKQRKFFIFFDNVMMQEIFTFLPWVSKVKQQVCINMYSMFTFVWIYSLILNLTYSSFRIFISKTQHLCLPNCFWHFAARHVQIEHNKRMFLFYPQFDEWLDKTVKMLLLPFKQLSAESEPWFWTEILGRLQTHRFWLMLAHAPHPHATASCLSAPLLLLDHLFFCFFGHSFVPFVLLLIQFISLSVTHPETIVIRL